MTNISVILADDDQLVLHDLTTIVNWQKLGFSITGTAGNGADALALIEKHPPSLLITDIIMPIMNGLELIEHVRRQYPSIHILIITSYDEFEYAKKAIEHGVAHYILKTEITTASLSQKLIEISSKIKAQVSLNQKNLCQELQQYMLAREDAPLPAEDFLNLRQLEGIRYHFFIISQNLFFTRELSFQTNEWVSSAESLKNLIAKADSIFENAPVFFSFQNYVIAGIQMEGSRESRLNMLSSLRNKIAATISTLHSHPCMLFYLNERWTVAELKQQLSKFQPLLLFYCFFCKEKPINLKELKPQDVLLSNKGYHFQKLSFTAGHSEEDIFDMKDYIMGCYNNRDMHSILQFYQKYCTHIEILCNNQMHFDTPVYLPSIELFLKWVFNTYEALINLQKSELHQTHSVPVEAAISYMEKKFGEYTLNAEEISLAVGLSAGRLGVLFKRDTGKTINEYLTSIRVDSAVYLLLNTSMKIYEISEKCGYRSSQYFSQIFYQKTGKRPIDYRKVPRI